MEKTSIYWALVLAVSVIGCGKNGDNDSSGSLSFFGNKSTETTNESPTGTEPYFGQSTDTVAENDTSVSTDTDVSISTDTGSDMPSDMQTETDTETDGFGFLSLSVCINHTPDVVTCRDCCDCKDDSCEDKALCRETCDDHDFEENSSFISFEVTSSMGETGDYNDCLIRGEASSCKMCCDCAVAYECGDRQHCRFACENIY